MSSLENFNRLAVKEIEYQGKLTKFIHVTRYQAVEQYSYIDKNKCTSPMDTSVIKCMKWSDLTKNYIDFTKYNEKQDYAVPTNQYLMIRALSKITTENVNKFNLRTGMSHIIEYMSHKGSSAYNLSHENNKRSFVSFFFTNATSASLFTGGAHYEPYYNSGFVSNAQSQWNEQMRGGLIINVPANHIIEAQKEDIGSPYQFTMMGIDGSHLRSEYGTYKGYAMNDDLSTPDKVLATGRLSAWNEVYFAPISYTQDNKMTTTDISAIFVYSPEKDTSKWPEKLQRYHLLAKKNNLPLVILWN